MEHVKYLIYRLRKEGYRNIWYCADGIYSIHGNLCDVAGLHKLLDEEENFYAYVDDAHGTGWCGKHGSGYVIGKYGLHNKMIVVESFAKSMAASGGGIIVPDKIISEYINLTGQTMIFSGPIQPPTLGALNASVKLHLSDGITKLQDELDDLIVFFRRRTSELGIPIITKDNTPIQLMKIGNIEKLFRILTKIIEKGFLAVTASYPAIAKGEDGLRITLTRHLSKTDINNFLECVKDTMVTEQLLS